jgi:hypothetical protein
MIDRLDDAGDLINESDTSDMIEDGHKVTGMLRRPGYEYKCITICWHVGSNETHPKLDICDWLSQPLSK